MANRFGEPMKERKTDTTACRRCALGEPMQALETLVSTLPCACIVRRRLTYVEAMKNRNVEQILEEVQIA